MHVLWEFADAHRPLFTGKLALPDSLLRAWSRAEDRRCVEGNPYPWRPVDPVMWGADPQPALRLGAH